jgi:hypothetical protein
MTQAIGLGLLAAVLAWWWFSMRARTVAVGTARRGCRAAGVQFLDESVVLRRMRPLRDANGRLRLRRCYAFEFTQSGGERRQGRVTLLGDRPLDVRLDPGTGGHGPGA